MKSIYSYSDPVYPPVPRRNPWKIATVLAAIFLVGLIGAYVVFSPFLTIWSMRNAALAKDGERFATYIDFPVFKENLKQELNAFMIAEMSTDQKLKDNPFAGLGMMIAPTLVNNMVDALVTPAGIERLMSGQLIPASPDAQAPTPASNPFTSNDVAFTYASINEFRVNVRVPDGRVTSLIFERHWVGDWKMAGVKLPR